MSAKYSTGVYQIRNLVNGKRYIGSAIRFSRRWNEHRTTLRIKRHCNRRLQNAWNKYGESAFVFEVILVCDAALCVFYEQIYLDAFRTWDKKIGYNLNPTANSALGAKRSAETKARMSAAQRGKVISQEHRAKLRAANLGKKWSAEARIKLSASNRGRKHSDEAKAKIGAKNRGRKLGPISAEVRARMAAAQLGKKQSPEAIAKQVASRRAGAGYKPKPESIAKMRAKLTGRKIPPEVVAKTAAFNRGRPLSLEHRAKIRAAALRRYRKPEQRQKQLF